MDNEYGSRPGISAGQLGKLILNLLTVLALLATVIVSLGFIVTFINPYWGINPYPPPTIPPTLGSPTPTVTPAKTLPPAWTLTPTNTPLASETPEPTDTPIATETPDVTETPVAVEMPFALQVGSPARMPNFVNDEGCNWMGMYGQVFDLDNSPILNLGVHLMGELEGLEEIDLYALTGSAPDLGPGAYLFNIADQPIASEEDLWIQLDDGSGGLLSDVIYIDTSDSCEENLIMVNFRQIREP
ncbi:MAG: hypothetical protein AMJ88_18620 [Anaerolineae bacterium SM23_ 63]|nr:MAG: hypothetical protein AMJ88_18620 [Anaerolineae bacterium SM23_ 63]HEY45359.1 hypothetical protein [Anaerolineae bacterium]